MTDKIVLNNLSSLQNETTAINVINGNSATITTAFDNTLSRDGTSPNTMSANLDMNSNRIINLPNAATLSEPLTLGQVGSVVIVATGPQGATGAIGSTGATGAQGPAGPPGTGSGNVNGPVTNTANNIPQWNGTNSLTLKDGLPVSTLGAALLNGSTLTTHGVLLGAATAQPVATAVMTNGQLLVGQSAADPLPKTISGDATLASSGALTVTSTSGTSFGTASAQNTGTSGGNVPLLNGNNTWSGTNSIPNVVYNNATTALATGYTWTTDALGTISSGTVTPNPSNGLKQSLTNNGAFTLAATAQIGDIELSVTNGASAGTITFSGFTKNWAGDSLDTTNGHNFVIFIYGLSNGTAYIIKALQ